MPLDRMPSISLGIIVHVGSRYQVVAGSLDEVAVQQMSVHP